MLKEQEKELLVRSQKGDIRAFEQLIVRHQKRIYNLSFKMLNNVDDADDAAQEIILRIFQKINLFQQQSAFSTWIYKITSNYCLDILRKKNQSSIIYSLDAPQLQGDHEMNLQILDHSPGPEELAIQSDIRDKIKYAITCLSADYRIIVCLRDIQGFTYDQISEILDCPVGTVKSRINRARAALREILKDSRELFA